MAVLLLLGSLLFLAGPAAACHVNLTVTNLISGDYDPDLEFSFTLWAPDPDGKLIYQTMIGGDDSVVFRLMPDRTYTLQQTTLPDGWTLMDLDSNIEDSFAEYDLENLLITFNTPTINQGDLDFTATFLNSPNNVPVPAAVWLLGSGVLALLGFRRKEKA